jgi:AcrR family transcriptional regulator
VPRSPTERIIDAALEALAEDGAEGLTMVDVARRAETSIGTLYRHFGDKEELIYRAHEAFLARVDQEATFDPCSAPNDREFIRALVGQLLRLLARYERLMHAFSVQGMIDPRIRERGSAEARVLARRFKNETLRVRDRFAHPSPEIAADLCFRLVYDTASRTATHGPGFATARRLTWTQLEHELATACSAYLLGTNGTDGGGS